MQGPPGHTVEDMGPDHVTGDGYGGTEADRVFIHDRLRELRDAEQLDENQIAGLETLTADAGVRSVWAGIRRRHGTAPRKVRAARTKIVTTMVAPLGDRLADVRDRALLLIGFAGALRRSELVALDVDDISEDEGRLRILLRRSKTDQEGETRTTGLPYGSHPATCPVRAWRAWLAASGIDTGPPSGPSTGTGGCARPG
jgi:integrase